MIRLRGQLKSSLSRFYENYRHLLLLLYFPVYLLWFNYLEKAVTTHFHVIHTAADDYIPFCEYFVIPYLLWFFYVAWGIIYMAKNNKADYYRLCAFLFTGMTVFLIISTVYPNGHYLRPQYFEHHNIFTSLCEALYSTDTPTNLFPSIHVYNSIAINTAVWHCGNFKSNRPVRYGSALLAVSIIASTMFLKQHSVFDVATGMVMAAFLCSFAYSGSPLRFPVRQPKYRGKLRQI